MTYRDIILTANANLRKSKLRTALTISAVFMGALTLMLTTGVGAGLRAYVDQQVNAVGAKDALIIMASTPADGPVSNNEAKAYDPDKKQSSPSAGNFVRLTAKDIDVIRKTPGIRSIEPNYQINPEFIANGNKKFTVTMSQSVEGLKQPLKTGRLVHGDSKAYEVTLPPAFVQPLGFKDDQDALGKKVNLGFKDATGRIFLLGATVTGVQEKTIIQGNAMMGNNTLARDAYDRATVGMPAFQKEQYVVAIAKYDTSMSEQQLKDLQQKLKGLGYEAHTLDDQLGIVKKIINGIITFLNVFAAIALAAASFGIVNTLLMAVQERTREIGLMKALGMGRGKIFALFSIEAVLIGLWGAAIALGTATIIGAIGSRIATNTIFKDFEGLQLFSFPAMSMVPIIALIMVIAFLAATLPAWRASRLNPIEALRYE